MARACQTAPWSTLTPRPQRPTTLQRTIAYRRLRPRRHSTAPPCRWPSHASWRRGWRCRLPCWPRQHERSRPNWASPTAATWARCAWGRWPMPASSQSCPSTTTWPRPRMIRPAAARDPPRPYVPFSLRGACPRQHALMVPPGWGWGWSTRAEGAAGAVDQFEAPHEFAARTFVDSSALLFGERPSRRVARVAEEAM